MILQSKVTKAIAEDDVMALRKTLNEIMNHFRCSNGDKVTKSVIDYRTREAKKKKLQLQLDEHGYNFCEECNRSSGTYFDCSHIISVNEAQNSGRAELCWDLDNITILCRDHHKQRDKNLIMSGKK